MTEWEIEQPTEPGWFWFYGWLDKSKEGRLEAMRHHMIHVTMEFNGLAFAEDGEKIRSYYIGRGFWQPIAKPEPPPHLAARIGNSRS